MFLLALLVICIATVPVFGGRLGRLADIEFRRPGAGISAVVLQTLILGIFPDGSHGLHAAVHLFSYALMFWFLAANMHMPGLWLLGLGGVLNALAIAANNGVMPAQPSALSAAGITSVPGEFVNSAAVQDPKLWFLGDVFALPADWPMANVFSVGDMLLIIGAFVLLHRVCGSMLAPRLTKLSAWADRTGPRLSLMRANKPFRRLWLALAISAIGDFVYPLAVFTAVVDDDTTTASIAFLLIAQVGPAMLVGLFGGPIIDRYSRKGLMIMTDLLRAASVASLLLADHPSLFHLYAVACFLGVGSAIFQPAMQATLPNIVRPRDLMAANAFVGVTLSLAVTIGPPLGAVIVTSLGVGWGFTMNAGSFLLSAALVALTTIPATGRTRKRARMTRELAEGFQYIRRSRPILAVVIVVGLITLGAGIKQPLEPLFALRTLDAGPSGYGLLGGVWGIGMVLAAAFAAAADRRFGRKHLITWSTLVVGLAVMLAAGSPSLGPVLLLWIVAGGANTLGTVAYETLIQNEAPDHVRGRVLAAVEASIHGGLLAGVALSTFAETAFGDQPSRPGLIVSGLVFMIAGVVSWRMLGDRPERVAKRAPVSVPFMVRGAELFPAGPGLSLLRLVTEGESGSAPVLLVDDGSRVHRVDPLPGGGLAYGVPSALLGRARTALALELRGRGLMDLPLPG